MPFLLQHSLIDGTAPVAMVTEHVASLFSSPRRGSVVHRSEETAEIKETRGALLSHGLDRTATQSLSIIPQDVISSLIYNAVTKRMMHGYQFLLLAQHRLR